MDLKLSEYTIILLSSGTRNSLENSPRQPLVFASGRIEAYVRRWNTRKCRT